MLNHCRKIFNVSLSSGKYFQSRCIRQSYRRISSEFLWQLKMNNNNSNSGRSSINNKITVDSDESHMMFRCVRFCLCVCVFHVETKSRSLIILIVCHIENKWVRFKFYFLIIMFRFFSLLPNNVANSRAKLFNCIFISLLILLFVRRCDDCVCALLIVFNIHLTSDNTILRIIQAAFHLCASFLFKYHCYFYYIFVINVLSLSRWMSVCLRLFFSSIILSYFLLVVRYKSTTFT